MAKFFRIGNWRIDPNEITAFLISEGTGAKATICLKSGKEIEFTGKGAELVISHLAGRVGGVDDWTEKVQPRRGD